MDGCVFCKIVRKELPAEVLFEDDHVIGILDINPIHYGHSLIIPKAHCEDFLGLPEAAHASVMTAAKKLTRAIVDGLDLEGYNLFTNNGRIAGQSVFHFHLHITPRYADDNIKFVLKLKRYEDGEMTATAETIRRHLTP